MSLNLDPRLADEAAVEAGVLNSIAIYASSHINRRRAGKAEMQARRDALFALAEESEREYLFSVAEAVHMGRSG